MSSSREMAALIPALCCLAGESIVALDFSFHAYRDVQIFFKKQCAAPASSILRDPSCSSGVPSEDGSGCCLASCGTCGGDGCEDREGGLMGCCLTHIRSSALPCELSNAPCIMAGKMARDLDESLLINLERMLQLVNHAFWLLSSVLFVRFVFVGCCSLATAFLLVYLFSFCHGVHVLKEPVPVAATPSVSQLLNSALMLTGHLRHLYRTQWGSSFGSNEFHSYSPFEENVHTTKPAKQALKADNPFFQNARWRSDEPETSFIRLTSFKNKTAQEKKNDPLQGARPMEFCDVEADASAGNTRACTDNDVLWGETQDEFTPHVWNDGDDTNGLVAGGSQHIHAAGGREAEEGFDDDLSRNPNQPFRF
ncbi:hypothetical protein Esti_001103 [Eimeria stiedai]